MILTNLLRTHIVLCRNLRLIKRWWLWVALRLWGSCTLGLKISIGLWRGLFPLLASWIAHGILVLVPSSVGMMRLGLLFMSWLSCRLSQPIRHGDQFHLRHHGINTAYQWCCHDHHLGPIDMLREESPHSTGSGFSHPGALMRTSRQLSVTFLCLSLFWDVFCLSFF